MTLSRSTRCAACSQGYGGLLKFASFKNVFGCYAETVVPLFIFVHIAFRALMLWSLPPWTSQETVLYTLPQTMGKFLPGTRGTTHASCTGRQTTQRLVCVLYMLNYFDSYRYCKKNKTLLQEKKSQDSLLCTGNLQQIT